MTCHCLVIEKMSFPRPPILRDVGDQPAKVGVKKLKGESTGVQLNTPGEKVSVPCTNAVIQPGDNGNRTVGQH